MTEHLLKDVCAFVVKITEDKTVCLIIKHPRSIIVSPYIYEKSLHLCFSPFVDEGSSIFCVIVVVCSASIAGFLYAFFLAGNKTITLVFCVVFEGQ